MRWVAVVVTGLAGALAANGCVEDPTFIQLDNDAGIDGSASGSSSSSGASSTSSSSSSSSSGTTPPPATCGPACALAGGSCNGSACQFTCPTLLPIGAAATACNTEVVCPPGMNCNVTCGMRACKKVTCNIPGFDCSITCNGDTACSDQVTATSAKTTITCSGNNACKKVDCEGPTSQCAVSCNGPACMPNDVKCCAKSSCTVNGSPGTCKM